MSAGNLSGRIGWVDFSREARKRALDALDAFEEPGTVDELGVGPLRDAFADALFPGTSTLQRRAKYFVLVPCAIRLALESGQSLRLIERECCRQMWETCGHLEKAGVIGNRGLNNGAAWIQRPPSEIYWAGMRTLEILTTRLSPGLWLSQAERLAANVEPRLNGQKRIEGIDDDQETGFAGWKCDFDFHLWQEIYPAFCKTFSQQALSPDLTPKEAAFLHHRILDSEATRGSVFAWCLEHGHIPLVDADTPVYTPSPETHSSFYRFARSVRRHVPPGTAALLDAACAVNRLVFPAKVLHNKLLAVHGTDAAMVWKTIEKAVPGWAETVDLSSVFSLFPDRVHPNLATFLRDLQRAFRRADFTEAEEIVRAREISIKGAYAKVLHPEKIEPDKWVGGGWLDYRLSTADRILRDIADAESGGSHA